MCVGSDVFTALCVCGQMQVYSTMCVISWVPLALYVFIKACLKHCSTMCMCFRVCLTHYMTDFMVVYSTLCFANFNRVPIAI